MVASLLNNGATIKLPWAPRGPKGELCHHHPGHKKKRNLVPMGFPKFPQGSLGLPGVPGFPGVACGSLAPPGLPGAPQTSPPRKSSIQRGGVMVGPPWGPMGPKGHWVQQSVAVLLPHHRSVERLQALH